MTKHRVTLREVAQQAGVSITTVSNVVRGWPYIAEETRVRVQEAIQELGYHPHPIAQGLRTGQMQTIGFIVPDLSSQYFASIVSVAEDIAQEHRYTVIVFSSHEDSRRQNESIRRATNRLVDGLLIAPVANVQITQEQIDNLPVPAVLIDRIPDGFSGPACSLDNFLVGQLATQHLIDLGHKRIAHISGPLTARPARDRLDGYEKTLDKHNIEYRRVETADTAWGCEEGYNAMHVLLQDKVRPTAVFASNDRVAIGALRAITEAGLTVPDHISLVGVDDIEVSAYSNPPLTTVHQPVHQMARQGIDLLISLIREEPREVLMHSLEPTLVRRHSTSQPPR